MENEITPTARTGSAITPGKLSSSEPQVKPPEPPDRGVVRAEMLARRAQKARAQVIAAHRSARRARQAAEDAAEADRVRQRAVLEAAEAPNPPRPA